MLMLVNDLVIVTMVFTTLEKLYLFKTNQSAL